MRHDYRRDDRVAGAWREHLDVYLDELVVEVNAAEVAILRATDPAKADQLEAKYAASDELHVRLRSCRNLLIDTMAALILLALLIGFVALAAPHAFAVRKLSGTSTPYAVPLMSLLLKLPTGAVTAVLGVLFGTAQQLFLQFVDKRAQRLPGAVTTAK